MADPTDHPLVLEGYASTSGIDAERCAFAPFAFKDIDRLPPLLLEHDHDRRVGRVESLSAIPFSVASQIMPLRGSLPALRRYPLSSIVLTARLMDRGFENWTAIRSEIMVVVIR